MYDSGMTLSNLVSALREEVDIAGSIPDSSYIRWASSLEQLLYSDLIFFASSQNVELTDGGFSLSSVSPGENEDNVRFDDILKIYGDGIEYSKCSIITSVIFTGEKNIFYEIGGNVKVSPISVPGTVTLVRRIRPKIKASLDSDIMLPYEWVELMASKLRGESYKLANDDGQAAKWLEDYNAQLSSFTEWVSKRQERYGE